MSYPQLLPDSDPAKDYVTFSVPNQHIVRKIEHDSDNEDNLRIQVFSKALIRRVDELAHLLTKYNVEAVPVDNRYEILVKLFVPTLPPYPPPPPPEPSEIGYVIHSPAAGQEDLEEELNIVNLLPDEEVDHESEPPTWCELERMENCLTRRPRLATIEEAEEEI
jgi:hypothetical protein